MLDCPFCDSDNVKISRVGDNQYAVICENCDAEGPKAPDERQAEDLWDDRL
jgi:transcription elongation factor Elf1